MRWSSWRGDYLSHLTNCPCSCPSSERFPPLQHCLWCQFKAQTLATLEVVVELAKENGCSAEVQSNKVLFPVKGIHLEAQGEKKAREIPNGLSSLDVVCYTVSFVLSIGAPE